MTDLHFLTIAELHAGYRSGKFSPVDVTRAFLDRIDRHDGEIRSFLTPTPERALEDAHRADKELREGIDRGPMHGIPYSLKDVIETKGVRTTGQSRSLSENYPDKDAHVERKLREGGGVLLGKNTTFEFAHGGPSWDAVAPPTRNPWNLKNHVSGSSSGTAAAIAAGFTPAGIGTDTGGSIRMPAAACGLAGFKPTYGRVGRTGVIPNCHSHDHVGPLTWTARDAAYVLTAIAGHDPDDFSSTRLPVPDYWSSLEDNAPARFRIGVPYRWFEEEDPVSPDVRAAFDQAMKTFSNMGAEIVPVRLPSLEAYADVKKVIAMSDLFAIHAKVLREAPHLLGASLRYRIQCGALIRAEDYIRAMQRRTQLIAATNEVFATIDYLATPTSEPAGLLEPSPMPAFFAEKPSTTPFNLTGNPALTVCNGFSEGGMPLSLQIVGHPFDETGVLAVGHIYETASAWRARRPQLHNQTVD